MLSTPRRNPQGLPEPETEPCLRRDHGVFLSSGRGARGSCPRSDRRADEGPFAVPRQRADQCPGSGPAADQFRVALLVAFALAYDRACSDFVRVAVYLDRCQRYSQLTWMLEAAGRIGLG